MKLPQKDIKNMSNSEIIAIKQTIEREIKRRIDLLNGNEEEGMEGLGALFG